MISLTINFISRLELYDELLLKKKKDKYNQTLIYFTSSIYPHIILIRRKNKKHKGIKKLIIN